MTDTLTSRPERRRKMTLVAQQPVADVNCPQCGHVVHFAACDAPLTWYQRLRHRRPVCGCTWWGADYAHKRVRKGVSRET